MDEKRVDENMCVGVRICETAALVSRTIFFSSSSLHLSTLSPPHIYTTTHTHTHSHSHTTTLYGRFALEASVAVDFSMIRGHFTVQRAPGHSSSWPSHPNHAIAPLRAPCTAPCTCMAGAVTPDAFLTTCGCWSIPPSHGRKWMSVDSLYRDRWRAVTTLWCGGAITFCSWEGASPTRSRVNLFGCTTHRLTSGKCWMRHLFIAPGMRRVS